MCITPFLCHQWLTSHSQLLSDFSYPNCALTKRSKPGTNLFSESFWLFPRREVSALVEFVVMDQVGICALCPTPRGLIEIFRKGAHGNWYRDIFRREKGKLVFPVQASRRDSSVRQPVECDVVEDVVARESLRHAVKDACHHLVTELVVVEYPRGEADR